VKCGSPRVVGTVTWHDGGGACYLQRAPPPSYSSVARKRADVPLLNREGVEHHVDAAALDDLDGVTAVGQAADTVDHLIAHVVRGAIAVHRLLIDAVEVDGNLAIPRALLRDVGDRRPREGVGGSVAVIGRGVDIVVDIVEAGGATPVVGPAAAAVGDVWIGIIDRRGQRQRRGV